MQRQVGLKNHKIKSFPGTGSNAVLTQVWVAMYYYLLLCFIKYQTKFRSFHYGTEPNIQRNYPGQGEFDRHFIFEFNQ